MSTSGTILLAGANRGVGLGLAREYLGRGWQVIATARDPGRAEALAQLRAAGGALMIEQLDVADPASAAGLRRRLAGRRLDVLFVVAGVGGYMDAPIHEVPPPGAAREFITNATGPVSLAEAGEGLLAPGSTVAFMTSVLGSVSGNTTGGYELYRASKAALNTLARSYALRHSGRPVLLLHPGWVRTDMGGPRAPETVEESARGLADVIAAHREPGIAYLDFRGATIAW